jgi:hypothetical protein
MKFQFGNFHENCQFKLFEIAKTGNCLKIQVTAQHRFQLKIWIKKFILQRKCEWLVYVSPRGEKKKGKEGFSFCSIDHDHARALFFKKH